MEMSAKKKKELSESPKAIQYKVFTAKELKPLVQKTRTTHKDIAHAFGFDSDSGIGNKLRGERKISTAELRIIDEYLAPKLGRFSTFKAVYGCDMPSVDSIESMHPKLLDAIGKVIVDACETGQMTLSPSFTPSAFYSNFLDNLK